MLYLDDYIKNNPLYNIKYPTNKKSICQHPNLQTVKGFSVFVGVAYKYYVKLYYLKIYIQNINKNNEEKIHLIYNFLYQTNSYLCFQKEYLYDEYVKKLLQNSFREIVKYIILNKEIDIDIYFLLGKLEIEYKQNYISLYDKEYTLSSPLQRKDLFNLISFHLKNKKINYFNINENFIFNHQYHIYYDLIINNEIIYISTNSKVSFKPNFRKLIYLYILLNKKINIKYITYINPRFCIEQSFLVENFIYCLKD